MNTAANLRDLYPELHGLPGVVSDLVPTIVPVVPKVVAFVLPSDKARPPISFDARQNTDVYPTVEGQPLPVMPAVDRFIPSNQTVEAAVMHEKLGLQMRPLTHHETLTDESGRQLHYSFDPMSGLYLLQGYTTNEVEVPIHYTELIDRGDYHLPPPLRNNGSEAYVSSLSAPPYMPRFAPAVVK
jgi:hypothetical protein